MAQLSIMPVSLPAVPVLPSGGTRKRYFLKILRRRSRLGGILPDGGAAVQSDARRAYAAPSFAGRVPRATIEPAQTGGRAMKILDEFKEFALRGNVVDMAVGIIIGGAFGTIVQSLVKDVIMPPIGLLLGGVDFSDIRIPLRSAGPGHDAVTMNIGTFINNLISFLIVAAAVFMLVKAINELRKHIEKPAPKAPPAPPPMEVYLKEIRDALVKK
jgi:large conductance mechanosensitive channel